MRAECHGFESKSRVVLGVVALHLCCLSPHYDSCSVPRLAVCIGLGLDMQISTQLKRATARNADTGEDEPAYYRISKRSVGNVLFMSRDYCA